MVENHDGKAVRTVLVIDCSPRQHHGVVVSPLGRVAPPLFAAVPEVAAGWIANDTIWETLPHCEGKVHLGGEGRRDIGYTLEIHYQYLNNTNLDIPARFFFVLTTSYPVDT